MVDTAVICVIVKHEEPYIEEWLDYHFKLGFDNVYIYDNGDICTLKPLEKQYQDKVTVIHFPGRCQQIRCYYAFALNYCYEHTWVAFIDVDEFIVLRKHNTIKELLHERCQTGALVLNWILFGSNGHDTYTPHPVLERFTKRQKGVHELTKWIVRINHLDIMVTPHFGKLLYGKAYDTNGVEATESIHAQGTEDVAAVYHYFTKSKEEFYQKCERGRADIPEKRDFMTHFEAHDKNEIEDTSALDFFRKNV